MIRAVWNDVVLAEAVHTVRLASNDYFPPEALRREYLTESSATTVCPWKGTAHYYTVTVGGEVNPEAGWYYPSPSRRARQIKDHVAFWRGVRIERDEAASVADRARAWLRGKP